MNDEPNFDVAQLASTEIYSPRVDETVRFFTKLLGMTETTRDGNSVYLRCYEDFYHHTLKVTHRDEPGLGSVTWRASSKNALERRAAAIEASGLGSGWSEGETGYGRTYRFASPDGHQQRLVWDVDYFKAGADQRSRLLNRPQKRPLQGVPVRRLDHVNLLCSDVNRNKDFFADALGFRVRERIISDAGPDIAAWMSVSALVHELAFMHDQSGARGRLHHVAFWYGYPQHLADIAEVFREEGVTIEAGPGKHGVTQALFLYAVEPGGNRVELFGDAGYLIFDPAWKSVDWKESELAEGIIWFGSQLPEEFFLYGTPHVKPGEASGAAVAQSA